MEKLKRRLFFWTLVVIFLIIAPTVILYARGYRFDSHRGVFVYGGAITIKTNPQTVSVTLNGKEDVSKQFNRINNSQNITGLLPADYDIRINAPGFKTWSKKTDVHSGLSSEFWNIVLVRDNYQKINYDDTSGIDKFYISPKNKFIIYNKEDGDNLSINIFNISSKKTEENYSINGWKIVDESRRENIEWSPQEDYLSVPVQKTVTVTPPAIKGQKTPAVPREETQYNYLIIDPANNNTLNLNELLGKNDIRSVRWDPQNKDFLFFLSENNLYRANIKDTTKTVIIGENLTSFDLSKTDVYFVQSPNNLVYKTSFDGQASKDQVTSSFPDNSTTAIERIIVYDTSRIAFIDANKNLYIYNEGENGNYFKKLSNDVEGVHFSDDGKKLLYWTNYEISVYFTRDWKVQPIRNEDATTNITRYSNKIENVQWYKDYEHVLFNTDQWVKMIELDDRDHRNCADLINTSDTNPYIRYNNSLEYLYFTDKTGDNSTLQSIVFPEPTPLLGIGG